MLELAFATKELRAICEDEMEAAAQLGPETAASLVKRVADLRAASHPLDLPLRQPRVGIGSDADHLFIDLDGRYSIVIRANHANPPRISGNGAIAWDRVSRIQLLRLELTCE